MPKCTIKSIPFPLFSSPVSVTATAFVPFGKEAYVNGAELSCIYQDLFGNAQIQTALLMSNLTGVSLCTAKLSHLVLPLLMVFCCLFDHIVFPSSQYRKRSKEGIWGQGRVCGRSRGTRNQKRLRKARFSWSVLQIMFSFFKKQVSGLYSLYNVWPLCCLATFWNNLAILQRELFKVYMSASKSNPLKLFSQSLVSALLSLLNIWQQDCYFPFSFCKVHVGSYRHMVAEMPS